VAKATAGNPESSLRRAFSPVADFTLREEAIGWAESEKKEIEKGGA
jgi:hypothetical protein